VTATAPVPAFTRAGPGWRYRLESLPIERLRGLAIAAALVVTSAAVHAVNLTSTPQRLAEEGDVVSRAWAVDNLHALGTGTYVYDHPPLGWLQLGAWTWLTRASGRGPNAVAAGRSAMLVALVVSAALVWILARRLGLPRWAAAIAVTLFGLSPLAVAVHRQVLLENLAVPWVLAAFVLACSPRQRLGALAASGACLGLAVLSSETALLLGPALALQLWRATVPATRRVVLTVAGSLFLVVCGTFVVVAAARGQLLPGGGHPSLVEGAWHQVFGRPATGSLLDGGSATRRTVSGWLGLDPIGPLLALVAAPVALMAVPRLAPAAVGFLAVAAVVVRPGHLPPSLVAVLLPLGAVLVAGVAAHAWPRLTHPAAGRRVGAGVGVALGVVVLGAWAGDGRALLAGDADRPLREATRWIVDNVPADQALIVDDAIWVDLVESGADPDQVTGYAALDADPDLGGDRPRPLWDHDIVVATATFRAFPGGHPQLEAAVRGSVVLESFGSGSQRVEVRRIGPDEPAPAAAPPSSSPSPESGTRPHDTQPAAGAGVALARNRSLSLSGGARRALLAGEVDERVTTVLVAIAASRPVSVEDFPAAGTVEPRRSVVLRAGSDAIARLVSGQQPPYRPSTVDVGDGGRLAVTYPP
jgi:hypothetical protein